jgi:hypothetical protein
MKKNWLMWAIGAGALYFLVKKKTPKTTSDTPSSDVGNQTNDAPVVPTSTPSTVVVAAPKVAPVAVTPAASPSVGTPPQTPVNLSKDKFSID